MNETHNGNLNKSKQPAPSMSQGAHSAGKSNGEEATLRKGNLPKAEAVRTAKPVEGAGLKSAKNQYESSGVHPMGSGKNATHVCSSGCDCEK